VHLGTSLNYGHYISLIKHDSVWFKYNDDLVNVRRKVNNAHLIYQLFDENSLHTIFGGISDKQTAYVLFLEKVEST
jgi:arginine repressor